MVLEMAITQPLGFSNLTAKEVITQSYLCHNDWSPNDHAMYLVSEEGFEPGYVETLPIVEWLAVLRQGAEL